MTASESRVFRLPDLGEGLQVAEIVSWAVAVGDHVVADQPLLSVETDKAVVEIPSPRSGRIAKLCGEVGERLEVGAPLVEYEEGEAEDPGALVGEISAAGVAAPAEDAEVSAASGRAKIKAAPAIRALARRLDVELSVISPSGPGGSITKADVERVAEVLAAAGPFEELKGVRRAMARNMTLSGSEVVLASVTEEADVEDWQKDSDITVRLARAIVAGVTAEPALNAWYDSRKNGRRINQRVDLGIAVDSADGLFVPVLRDVANRDATDLRAGLDAMMADVKARTVPAAELRGQTITLSNFGTMAGIFGTLVVVPPQVAILGAGRLHEKVVARDGAAQVRRILPLSLSFDHRVVTGGEASRFLAAVKADLEQAE